MTLLCNNAGVKVVVGSAVASELLLPTSSIHVAVVAEPNRPPLVIPTGSAVEGTALLYRVVISHKP